MKYVRNYTILTARLAKMYLYPNKLIHCDYCGWFPYNGVYSYLGRGNTCCEVEVWIKNPQTRLF